MIDWHKIFTLDVPILEIFIRGSIVYLSLFIMLRLVLKRQTGSIGLTDLLVIVLIADASQNAMAGEYNSVPDGLILVFTLIFWNYALEWLSYHVKFLSPLIDPPPLLLIKNGKMMIKNMRQELITRQELLSQIRQQGIENIKEIRRAYIEGDGRISILKFEDEKLDN